jgi:hypothetical protein
MEKNLEIQQVIQSYKEPIEEERAYLLRDIKSDISASSKKVIIAEILRLNRLLIEVEDFDGIFIPPTRPNLIARSFRLRTDHENRVLNVAGIIRNSGTTLQAPFIVTIGISLTFLNGSVVESRTIEKTFEVPGNVIIPGNGGEYITEFVPVPLHYITDDFRNRYVFEMIVDSNQNIIEGQDSDNFVSIPYFIGRP